MNLICKKCKVEKDESYFYKHNSNLTKRSGACSDCINAYKKNWYLKNKDKVIQRSKNNYQENKERHISYCLRYRKIKPWVHAKNQRKRYAILRLATPKWLTEEQIKIMKDFYKNRPHGYVVDHIMPIRGTNITGLHVPWNLQYLTQEENSLKSNKIPVISGPLSDIGNSQRKDG